MVLHPLVLISDELEDGGWLGLDALLSIEGSIAEADRGFSAQYACYW